MVMLTTFAFCLSIFVGFSKIMISNLTFLSDNSFDVRLLSLEKGEVMIILIIIFVLLLITTVSLLLYLQTVQKRSKDLQKLFSENLMQKKILDSLFQTSPVGIVITSLDGTIFSSNKEFFSLFEFEKESFSNGEKIQEIIKNNNFSEHFKSIIENSFEKDKVEFDFSIVLTNGTTRFFHHICTKENFESLLGEMLIHIFVDITSQKNLELKLKKNEEKYRTYIELSSDAIWCFEAKEPIPINLPLEQQVELIFRTSFLADCNLAFAKFYGFSSVDEAIGTPLSHIIYPDNPSKIALITNFIQDNYCLNGFITNFTDTNGQTYYVRNSLFGVVIDGYILRAWGAFQNITELIELQRQYQETATKYENLVENVNSIILHIDLNGKILYMNNYGLKFFGYTKDELFGKHVIGTIVPSEESGTGRNLEELLREILENPIKYEYNENENIKKDGSRVWISWKNTPIIDSQGKCIEILSVGIDMTERKRKEIELKRTWDFIYTMLDSFPDAVSLKDGEGRWVYANKSMLEIFNLVGKDVIGKTDAELIEYDEFFRNELEGCILSDKLAWESRSIIQNEEVIRKKDGGESIYDVLKVPLFNDDGSRRGIAIVARDVTFRKNAEKALKESERKYKEIVDALPLPALVVSEGKISFANNFANNVFSEILNSLEVDFSALKNYFKDSDYEKLEKIAKLEEKNQVTSFHIETIDGGKVFSVSWVPILFGTKSSILFVFSDVTEQILYSSYLEKVQRELIYQKYELERINKELNEKNKELAELNATKDRFFSIIAHDLKNPVYGIKNLSEEFLNSFHDLKLEEMHDFVFALNSSATKLADLIENLLLWARTQTRTLNYNPVEINLKYLVDNTVSFFSENAKQKNIILLSRIDENAKVYADVNCVSTILRNLISNSIKFTNEGGVVRIFSQTIEENGKLFEKISVQDNGIGIPYEVQEKLLQLDFHFTALGTKNERGTGLGLNITKELVEINGGRLWFESTPKVGTTFYFILPKNKGG